MRINRVGITDLDSIIRIRQGSRTYVHIPKISVLIDLSEKERGIHMSRLIESINDIFEAEREIKHFSLEDVGLAILKKLKEKHEFARGEIIISSKLILLKKTPVSQKKTTEAYNVEVRVVLDGGARKAVKVEAIGSTCCPHALKNSGGKRSHVQRAIGTLEIEADFEVPLKMEDMIKAVENSFSAKTYSVLKSEDETEVVRQMYENPRFVEDVVREMAKKAEKLVNKGKIKASCTSLESIHKHNAFAEIVREK